MGDRYGVETVLKNIECRDLIQKIEEYTRLGEPRENGGRLLKLVMESEDDVERILSNKEKLRDSVIPKVYINEDLSKSERIRAYHARLKKRSSAAESVEISGREWGNIRTMGDFIQRERQRDTDNRGMGGRGRWSSVDPPQVRQQESERVDLPEGWIERVGSDSGRIFYKNTITGRKQYEFPTETARRQRDEDHAYRGGRQGQNEREQFPNRGRSNSGNQRNGNRNNATPAGNYGEWGNPADW